MIFRNLCCLLLVALSTVLTLPAQSFSDRNPEYRLERSDVLEINIATPRSSIRR